MKDIRIGHGYDAHRFAEDDDQRPLVLGGITIPYERGLIAHSDGDALVHALCDALLGALGLGDIGQHFPDSDAAYKNVDSTLLLQQVVSMMKEAGWKVSNTDITILAQAPKMAPHVSAMRNRLAGLIEVKPDQVNIKASTTEGMGFVGRKEGLEAYAVAILYR